MSERKDHKRQRNNPYKALCGREIVEGNNWGLSMCETCIRIEEREDAKRLAGRKS